MGGTIYDLGTINAGSPSNSTAPTTITIADIYRHYYVPGIILNSFHVILNLTLQKPLRNPHSHFTEEEAEHGWSAWFA